MSLPEIDKLVFFLINKDIQNSFFDIIMPFVTGKSYLIFLPFFLWIFFKDKKKALIVLALAFASVLLSDWASNILKYYFERIRPCADLAGVRVLAGCGKSFSMPSNHAANAFGFASLFYFLIESRIRYIFIIIAFLVGLSRIYVGVHYPSDVIVGALLGITTGYSVMKLYAWSAERSKIKPYSTLLFAFLLIVGLFRIYYILNGPLDLSPDEAHYWEWSRRLDLSYYSKGPMIAYLIYMGTAIFGDKVFGIRIMAVIFSTVSSIFLFILVKKMYDERTGFFSAVLIQGIPLFSAFGILFTIDSPFIFFWILSLFFFYGAIRNQDFSMVYWRLLGLSVGLGLLTKYTMAFFYLCAFLFLLSSKEHRKILLTRGPYIALIISLLSFSPVIIWNAKHDWVTLRHTAGQAHISEGLQVFFKSFVEFLGSQFGVITPLLFILMVVSVWCLKKRQNRGFLLWFSAPVIIFFLLKSLQAKVQANWALPGYITGIVAFSVFYLKPFGPAGKLKKIFAIAAVLISFAVTAIAHYPSMLKLPAELDPTLRLQGWKELGDEVSDIYEQMSSQRKTFIFSDRYQVSSELAFYVKGHPVTYCINLNRRMNQYDLWPGFQNLIHYNAVLVRTGDTALPENIASAFGKVEKKVFTAYTKKHDEIRDYSLFLCYDFKGLNSKKPETY